MKKATALDLKEISETFEQDEYAIPQALEYYVGMDSKPTIEGIKHPDNLWSVLDRMHTIVLDDEDLSEEHKRFLHHFLEKWMDEISPYCVRLESE